MIKIISVVCCVSILLCLGCKGESRISQTEAESAVRNFEANSSLQFDTIELGTDTMNTNYAPMNPSASREYYILGTTTPSRSWYVHSQTGEVCVATYDNLWEDLTVERQPFGPYTQAQCRNIALAFARSKYADFDSQGFTCKDESWGLNCWGFTWTQTILPGAITPRYVDIFVNPGTGQVVRYSGEHVTVAPIVSTPITPQQAVDAAFNYYQITANRQVDDTPVLYVDEQGNLYYLVNQSGNQADGNYVDISATLDAVTGNILWDMSTGSTKYSKSNLNTMIKKEKIKKASPLVDINKEKVEKQKNKPVIHKKIPANVKKKSTTPKLNNWANGHKDRFGISR